MRATNSPTKIKMIADINAQIAEFFAADGEMKVYTTEGIHAESIKKLDDKRARIYADEYAFIADNYPEDSERRDPVISGCCSGAYGAFVVDDTRNVPELPKKYKRVQLVLSRGKSPRQMNYEEFTKTLDATRPINNNSITP